MENTPMIQKSTFSCTYSFSRMAVRSQTEQLCIASANGYLAGVKQCLQNGAEVNGYNAHGRTPLQVGVSFSFFHGFLFRKKCSPQNSELKLPYISLF
jgi:hypothetical protein